MTIVDASVAADFILGRDTEAAYALTALIGQRAALSAPHLLDAEVAEAVRRWRLLDDISEMDATSALDDLHSMPLERYPHAALLRRAFDLRHNLTIYGGLYIALAELLDVPLLTGDAAYVQVPGSSARIEVVSTRTR